MAEKSIQIVTQSSTSWQVILSLPKDNVSDEYLLDIFRMAKRKIAEASKIPVEQLHYKDLVRKELSADTSRISVIMEKFNPQQGDPALKLLPEKGEDSAEYENINLTLDVFPVTSKGAKPEYPTIETMIKETISVYEFVDFENVFNLVEKVNKSGEALKGEIIGKGKIPGTSTDGKVEYVCSVKDMGTKGRIGVEKVEPGKLLCRRTPAKKSLDEGKDLMGKRLAPRVPNDFELVIGDKVRLSADRCEIFSDGTGLLRIKESVSDKFPYITWLTFGVENIAQIDGSKAVNITADKPVEIKGGLKKGSTVVSEFEVIVNGNVEDGANIHTASNIVVNGDITGANMVGTDSIDVENVKESKLVAEGKLTIRGTVSNSYISGKEVYAHKVVDCTVVAAEKLVVEEIQFTGEKSKTKLKAGVKNQLQDIKVENEKFMTFADNNLKSMTKLFGDDIILNIKPSNIPQMLLKHIENMRKAGAKMLTPEQRQALIDLLTAIPPLKNLSVDKRNSLKSISKKMEGGGGMPEIFIKNAIDGSVEIDLDGIVKQMNQIKAMTRFITAEGAITETGITEKVFV